MGQHICTQISCSQSATSQAFTRRGNSINPDCFGLMKQLVTQLWSKGSVPNPVTLHRMHPLSRKIFRRGIRKCPGCKKPLSTTIEGYNEEDDKEYCFGYFEAYNFWNKSTKRHQTTTSTQHYHLNPVCTKVRQSEGTLKIST